MTISKATVVLFIVSNLLNFIFGLVIGVYLL